jgi:hypothetical protein
VEHTIRVGTVVRKYVGIVSQCQYHGWQIVIAASVVVVYVVTQ